MAKESDARCWEHTREALEKLENLLKCGKCGLLLTEPCSLGSCEHLFCRSCVWRDVGNSCPVCDMPAWVKDLQTNRRLSTLVSLSVQLRDVIEGRTSDKHLGDHDVKKTEKKAEASNDCTTSKGKIAENVEENRDVETEEQDVSSEINPCDQDHKGVAEQVPDYQPYLSQQSGLKTILKATTPQESVDENSAANTAKDISELHNSITDHGKEPAKEQGNSSQRYQLTLRARTKKDYTEENDTPETDSEREPTEVAVQSPNPLSVFDFHGSPTRPKKVSKPRDKKTKNPAMSFFKPAAEPAGGKSGQVTKGRRFGRVTKERLANMNQQWGFSDSGRKKKGGRRTSPENSQGENSFARKVSFAVAQGAGKCVEITNEGVKEAVMEETKKSPGMRNEGTEETTAGETEKSTDMVNKRIEETTIEEAKDSAQVKDEGIQGAILEDSGNREAVIEETGPEDVSMEEEDCKGAQNVKKVSEDGLKRYAKTKPKAGKKILAEDNEEGQDKVSTEVESSSVPEDIEMIEMDRCDIPKRKYTASPSADGTGDNAGFKRRSGRLHVGMVSTESAGTTCHQPDLTLTPVSHLQTKKAKNLKSSESGSKGRGSSVTSRGERCSPCGSPVNKSSPQNHHTPKARHSKKRKSPMARKTLLSDEEDTDKPLKNKKILMENHSATRAKEDGGNNLGRKVDDKVNKTTKDGGKGSLSPTSTPQSRSRSKDRRSRVLTPRGQRFSPRGSPGHVMKRNVRGETPLHLAAIKGDAETIAQLLQEGADPNVKDNAGWTPLHEASNHGHTRAAEILLDHGALINTTAFENDSPLHDAVQNNRVEVARLLVSRGASLDVRNIHGYLPGDYATTDAMRAALNTRPLHTQPQVAVATSSQVDQVVALATGLDTKQREELEQCMLVLDGKVVRTFSDQVTHLITACDEAGRCPRTIKYLRGILTGKWIVNFKWVSACMGKEQHVAELPYEVQGTTACPDSTGASKGRLNREQQLPGLFDGCHFFLHGKFQAPTPPRRELVELIKDGGGSILAREPKPDSDCTQASTTVAYHARPDSELAHCSHFILYDEKSAKTPPKIRTAKLCTVPVSWLMGCVTVFSLVDLPN